MRSALKSTLAVLVVATAALGVVAAAATAATLPELVNNKGVELAKNKFTIKGTSNGSYVLLETTKRNTVRCSGLSGNGEVKGTKGGEATFTYTTCLGAGGKCTTAGAKEGEIKVTTSIAPVWLSKTAEEVALLISVKPVTNGGIQFTCDGSLSRVTLSGAFLVPVAINKLKTTYNLAAREFNGVQNLHEYENEAGEKVTATLESESFSPIESWSKEQSGTEIPWENIFEEEAEFKA